MRGNELRGSLLRVCIAATILMASCTLASGQEETAQTAPTPAQAEKAPDVRALADAIRSLQAQVQTLSSQVSELRTEEQRWHAEARELRSELELTRAQLGSHADALNYAEASTPSQRVLPPSSNSNLNSIPPVTIQTTSVPTLEERLAKLEDSQDLVDAKINEQSQTKVESGSKYRVRLSGILLLNLFDTRGPVDNVDFPQLAVPATFGNSSNAFAATIRQSQIGLEVFGPEIAGAHTSADVKFDFAGGFADLPNGVSMGVARLRTGTVRMDWANTSIIAGQDSLFFAPLMPTSLSSLAIPPLAYAGNLWSWTPQIRIEHRKDLNEASSLLFQAGILDSLTGDIPMQGYRYPTAGEQSGQPAYAGRIAWSHHLFERSFTAGAGGYYGRQNWGFGRDVDGWAVTADVSVPLGRFFAVTGEFYRGRAVGGLAGGVGQDILLSGTVSDPTTSIRGLNSIGGWTQLKFKPTAKFQVNAALGDDNPFASELRRFPSTQYYYGYSISRNLSPFINFIYQVRSDVLFSAEYKRIQTYTLDSNFNAANQFGISVGYIF
jgi:regulator of replication initiation timing